MVTFKCASCKDMHRLNNRYDQQDYECPSTHLYKRKRFQDVVPDNIYEKNNWTLNSKSTKVDEYKSVTVIPSVLKSDDNRFNNAGKRKTFNY